MVSVIMLTYNRENYIERAIKSVIQQTYRDFEFIIVDNGSSDRSGTIADAYAKQDKRIRVIHTEQSSIGRGRNAGLEAAGGEYIAFIDDDDVIEPDMLEFLYAMVQEEKADIAICGAQKNVNGAILPHSVWEDRCIWNATDAVRELLERKRNNAGLPTKLIRKELLLENPFKEDCRYEDIWTCYKYMACAKKVIAWGVPKYCFTRHETNNSSFTQNAGLWKAEQMEEYLAAFRERTLFVSEKLPALSNLVQYSEWSYMISMCQKVKFYDIQGCQNVYHRMASELSLHAEDFLHAEYIQDFEKEWMHKYIL